LYTYSTEVPSKVQIFRTELQSTEVLSYESTFERGYIATYSYPEVRKYFSTSYGSIIPSYGSTSVLPEVRVRKWAARPIEPIKNDPRASSWPRRPFKVWT